MNWCGHPHKTWTCNSTLKLGLDLKPAKSFIPGSWALKFSQDSYGVLSISWSKFDVNPCHTFHFRCILSSDVHLPQRVRVRLTRFLRSCHASFHRITACDTLLGRSRREEHLHVFQSTEPNNAHALEKVKSRKKGAFWQFRLKGYENHENLPKLTEEDIEMIVHSIDSRVV